MEGHGGWWLNPEPQYELRTPMKVLHVLATHQFRQHMEQDLLQGFVQR